MCGVQGIDGSVSRSLYLVVYSRSQHVHTKTTYQVFGNHYDYVIGCAVRKSKRSASTLNSLRYTKRVRATLRVVMLRCLFNFQNTTHYESLTFDSRYKTYSYSCGDYYKYRDTR